MLVISASKRKFLSWLASGGLASAIGCTGTNSQRTNVVVPSALVKRNALRLWKVLLSKPDVGAQLLMIPMARAKSGWLAKNAAPFAGSGLCVLGSGSDATRLS